jgi:hypothetical protein
MRQELSNLENDTQGSNEPLSEPHFDDEVTLLSARRVVPFHKLTEETNSKRHLFFGATVAAALVMGVIGGVIYARLEGTPAPKAETAQPVAQPALPDQFVSSSGQSDASSSVADESKTLADDKGNQKIIDKPAISPRKHVALNPSPAKRVQTEPREIRRARRQAAPEAQHSNDIFRIREIFEGSSRP